MLCYLLDSINQYLGEYRYSPTPSKRETYADSKPQIWDVELFDCALPWNLVVRLAKLTAFSPCLFSIFFYSAASSSRQRRPHYRGFTITLRHATLGRSPLDEWSARHRYLYLITHKTHRRLISMPLAGFEPLIPASERPQTHAFRRAATGIGPFILK